MTTIKVSELHPAGYDLLADPESYINQLSNNELSSVRGGEDFTNDTGDWVGGTINSAAGNVASLGAALSVAATPASSTPACGAAGAAGFAAELGFLAAASVETHN